MPIDGKQIAKTLLASLSKDVVALAKQGITPTLAVIQIGDDPASTAYIRQKQKAATAIGAKLVISNHESGIRNHELKNCIDQFNHDASVHGIILQRPLPPGIRSDGIIPVKDVDGFLPGSPYQVPVAMAVLKILEKIFPDSSFLIHHSVVVLGRGETAGGPIAEALRKRGVDPIVLHSQTSNPDAIIKTADVVISCVGKPNVVRRDFLKPGVALVSVGIWRDSKGKLHGDYEESDIADVASAYTPTPGGVGPVNVACLMANLLHATNSSL